VGLDLMLGGKFFDNRSKPYYASDRHVCMYRSVLRPRFIVSNSCVACHRSLLARVGRAFLRLGDVERESGESQLFLDFSMNRETGSARAGSDQHNMPASFTSTSLN
jgi:hypothetical protein